MHEAIKNIIRKRVPVFNEKFCEGLAYSEAKKLPKLLDDMFRCVFEKPIRGLRYERMRFCSPAEEYAVATAKSYEEHTFELAKNDVRLAAFEFSHNGEPLPRPVYMYIPYIRPGGILHLRGVKYHVSPVAIDPGLSIEDNSIFIWLTKIKLIFKRLTHSFLANDQCVNRSIACADIYHINEDAKSRQLPQNERNKAQTTMSHYVFCKYGLTESFRRYAKTDVVIGATADLTSDKYPSDEWVICRSLGIAPPKVRTSLYNTSDLAIAIKREDWGPIAQNLATALFYLADHFPERLQPDYVDYTNTWQILLGHVIFKSNEGEGILRDYILTHMKSIEEYLDTISKLTLKMAGIEEEDIYGLFVKIDETIAVRLLESDPSNMYGKRLTVLNYLAFPYVVAINNLGFGLNSSKKEELTMDDVRKIMSSTLKRDLILGSGNGNNFINVVSNPGDNLIFKVTSKIVPQSKATGKQNSKRSSQIGLGEILHASVAEVGSVGNLPKTNPTGRTVGNTCIKFHEEGTVYASEETKHILEPIQESISRRN